MKRSKSLQCILAGLLFFCVPAAGGAGTGLSAIQEESDAADSCSAASINGNPVEEEALLLYLRDQKAAAVSHYANLGADTSAEGFWNDESLDPVPVVYAARRALDALNADWQLFSMADEAGLMDWNGYEDLIVQMEQENREREAKKDAGEPVYGQSTFTPWTWIQYLRSQLKSALQAELEKEADPSDAELEELLAKRSDLFESGRIYTWVSIAPDGNSETVVFNDRDLGKADTLMEELLSRLDECTPGDVLEHVQTEEGECTVVLQSIEENGQEAAADVKEQLIPFYAAEQFENRLQQRVENADVFLDEKAAASLQMP